MGPWRAATTLAMTTIDLRALTRLALLVPLASALACADEGEPTEEGELRVGLWGEGASGQTYSLHGSFFFDGYYRNAARIRSSPRLRRRARFISR